MRGFFSFIYGEHLVKSLEANLTILWKPLYDWVPLECLILRLIFLSLQQFNCYPDFPTPPLVPKTTCESSVNCDSVFACLPNLWSCGLPCVLPSLIDPRRVVELPGYSASFFSIHYWFQQIPLGENHQVLGLFLCGSLFSQVSAT